MIQALCCVIGLIAGVLVLGAVAAVRTVLFFRSARGGPGLDLWTGLPPDFCTWFPRYLDNRQGWYAILGIAGGVLTYGALVHLWLMRYRDIGRRVCARCGYDLRGLVEPRCPECGTPFDPSLLRDGLGEQAGIPGGAKPGSDRRTENSHEASS